MLQLMPLDLGEVWSKSNGYVLLERGTECGGGIRPRCPAYFVVRRQQLQPWNFILSEEMFITFHPVEQMKRYHWNEFGRCEVQHKDENLTMTIINHAFTELSHLKSR